MPITRKAVVSKEKEVSKATVTPTTTAAASTSSSSYSSSSTAKPTSQVATASSVAPVSATTTKTTASVTKTVKKPSHDEIAARAYSIWEREGCPQGAEMKHWLLAERELGEGK